MSLLTQVEQSISGELAQICVAVIGLSRMYEEGIMNKEDMKMVEQLITRKCVAEILDRLLGKTKRKEELLHFFQSEVKRQGKIAFGKDANIQIDLELKQ